MKFPHCLGNRKNRKKWVTFEEDTQAACHVSVYLLWLVLFLALCVHSSAGMGVIYYHLPCQSSPWSPPSISQSRQHCLPPSPPCNSSRALTACITPCSAFKPAAEETHSDNYSIGAPTHREPGLHDMRWTLIERRSGRLWGRTGSESREGYRKVRQITERGEGREEQDERRKMREMRRRRKGKIPAAEKNGRRKDLKNKAVEAFGELNILRRIELNLSKNNTNWRRVWHKADA